jgi:hypothetical protein
MFLTVLITVLLVASFFLLGAGLTFKIIGFSSDYFIPVSIISGFSILLYTSWLFSIDSLFFAPVLVISSIIIIGTSYKFFAANESKKFISTSFTDTFKYFIPGYLVIYFSQFTDLFYQGFRLRTGPDLAGWLISANYFEKNSNLNNLTASLTSQLGSPNLFFSKSNSSSVYSIPSFTEQVQAEFLIGSGRTGLPSLLGFLSRLTDYIDSASILISLMSLFGGITSILVLNFAKSCNAGLKTKIIAFLTSIGSTAVLSPIFEGGVWHVFAIPLIFLALTNTFVSGNSKYVLNLDRLLFGILIAFTLTISSDVAVVSIPVIVSVLFRYHRDGNLKKLLSLMTPLILFVPGIELIRTSLSSRSQNAFLGGWSATSLGLPGDYVGLTLWQNALGVNSSNQLFTFQGLLAGIVATFVGVYVFLKCRNDFKVKLIPYFASLSIIYCYFYLQIIHLGSNNTYVVWKLSFLWTIPFTILLVLFFSYHPVVVKKSKGIKVQHKFKGETELRSSFESFLLTWVSIVFIVFFSQWVENSRVVPFPKVLQQNSPERVQLSKLLDRYTLVGGCTPAPQTLAYFGDLHLSVERRGGTTVKESIPSRIKVVVVSDDARECEGFVQSLDSATKVAKIQNLTFYSINNAEWMRITK